MLTLMAGTEAGPRNLTLKLFSERASGSTYRMAMFRTDLDRGSLHQGGLGTRPTGASRNRKSRRIVMLSASRFNRWRTLQSSPGKNWCRTGTCREAVRA